MVRGMKFPAAFLIASAVAWSSIGTGLAADRECSLTKLLNADVIGSDSGKIGPVHDVILDGANRVSGMIVVPSGHPADEPGSIAYRFVPSDLFGSCTNDALRIALTAEDIESNPPFYYLTDPRGTADADALQPGEKSLRGLLQLPMILVLSQARDPEPVEVDVRLVDLTADIGRSNAATAFFVEEEYRQPSHYRIGLAGATLAFSSQGTLRVIVRDGGHDTPEDIISSRMKSSGKGRVN